MSATSPLRPVLPPDIRARKGSAPLVVLTAYTTPVALQYDSGNYHATLDQAMASADWAGFPARRAEAAKRGKLRGIGCSTYLEACGLAAEGVEAAALEAFKHQAMRDAARFYALCL